MRAAWYERNGPAGEVLQVGDMPDPQPGPGEVRVRVYASGVNPSDWKTRSGSRPMVTPRVVPHSDGAGIIDQVGAGVDPVRVGERVWIWNGQWKRPFGTAAELIALPSEQAVPLPETISFEAGACLGIPALTAHRAVTVDGSLEGQTVLVAGGAGAVGLYAVQMAKLLGAARVIATVSSPEKARHASEAGADEVIDYKREDVAERIVALTGGRGADRVVEVDIAGNAALLPRVVARDGLCVVYGSNAPQACLEFGPMILSGAAVRFFIVYELSREARQRGIADLTRWMTDGCLKHTIGATFPLDAVVEAHECVESGRVVGNVVVSP
ncbi:Quinone oxidoreductase 1 [Methylobacterium crusticola]|uniref:Quinone oxidoreductase 1 n=1 Tax=Methylobacterium crusticola TaxID=1697972 RepID=A0ABQ4R9S7_9HYPH|nr:NADPH:quinone reductase [Methylobacterium crusticola]GJD53930.1 Quinone oxidoreductase 1 [Methylobacterium crusticola]